VSVIIDKIKSIIASAPGDQKGAAELQVILNNGAAFQGAATLDDSLLTMLSVMTDQQGRPVGIVEVSIDVSTIVAVVVKADVETPNLIVPEKGGKIIIPGKRH
jgi:hypothetical protein